MSSANKAALRVDWCSHRAAKYAVENWHYSRKMPLPPIVHVGAWESGAFVGCVLFARGANKNIAAPYGLTATECCELVRVALRAHESPVTRIVALALRFLCKSSPGIRLVVSYADPSEGHHGGIYQGGNWMYCGRTEPSVQYLHDGEWKHSREIACRTAYGKPRRIADPKTLRSRVTEGKHRYLMPLDDEMRARIAHLSQPYPKRSPA